MTGCHPGRGNVRCKGLETEMLCFLLCLKNRTMSSVGASEWGRPCPSVLMWSLGVLVLWMGWFHGGFRAEQWHVCEGFLGCCAKDLDMSSRSKNGNWWWGQLVYPEDQTRAGWEILKNLFWALLVINWNQGRWGKRWGRKGLLSFCLSSYKTVTKLWVIRLRVKIIHFP